MNIKQSLKKTALITGGITGIGLDVSLTLQKAGYTVLANYPPSMVSVAQEIHKKHNISIIEFDASDYVSVKNSLQDFMKTNGSIDILINNAGITRDRFLHKMSVEEWRSVISINLDSVFNCCHVVVPYMREQEFGRIINMSSVNALRGQIGQTNYCASKAAIIGFTKALALENATKGITVNAIAPGYVDTDMVKKIDETILKEQILAQIPMNRLAKTSEISALIKHLINDESAYITGQTISINGGLHVN
jgi:acetoacetyl-CoA reductase